MKLLDRFRRKPRPEDRLYEAVLNDARQPALFGPGRAADTVDGRFEMLALHFTLVYRRLRALDETYAQSLFDRFVKDMDANLRELGTGDARFGKTMKHMVASLYGRIQSYSEALDAKDAGALAEKIDRNAEGDIGEAFAPGLAEHALRADAAAQDVSLETLLAGRTGLPVYSS